MLRKAFAIASIAVLSFGAVSPVFAGETSNPQYGGQTPNITVTIDKKVSDPNSIVKKTTATKGGTTETVEESDHKKYTYVENITAANTDMRYSPTQKIAFKLVVTNTSNQDIKNVVVTDTVPLDTVANISGDGTFDSQKKTVTIKVGDMKANESKEYYITGTIVTADRLPSEQPVICSVNQSNVSVEGNVMDDDNATFCIEKETGTVTKGGKPVHTAPTVEKTPPTGPAAFALIPLAASAIAGFALRRKSS